MSKAFTREDDLPDPGTPRRVPSPLPPGAKNYVTPEGAKRLRAELDGLIEQERHHAGAQSAAGASRGPGERDPALAERVHHLRRSLETAVIVNPPAGEVDSVRFGATVSVRGGTGGASGDVTRYRIVGVDETDVERGWISWVSPIAKALLSRKVGDRVALTLPAGEKELEIVGIAYD